MCYFREKKKLTYKRNNNNLNKHDVTMTTLFYCAVRITSMTMENEECMTCRLKLCTMNLLKMKFKIKINCCCSDKLGEMSHNKVLTMSDGITRKCVV